MTMSADLHQPAWPDLHDRLMARFPGVAPAAVAETVIHVAHVTALFGLTGVEAAQRGEQVAVSMIRQQTGQDPALPRVFPEKHSRRKRG